MRNSSTTNTGATRRVRRGRVTAALAAGIITVVVGSLDTASAEAPEGGRQVHVADAPEGGRQVHGRAVHGRQVHSAEARQFAGGAAGGRLTFR